MAQLTEMKIKAIKPGAKMARYYDSGGLYLQVSPVGGKYWRFKYRVEKKEKLVALGTWPQVSLKEAREKRDQCRQEIAAGNDPMQLKKARAEAACPGRTFQEVAEAWRNNMENVWSESHAKTIRERLALNVYPVLGKKDIAGIRPTEILSMLRKIEARGAYETAQRVLGICGQIFRYGVAVGLLESDPSRDLRGALVPHQGKQLAAITDPAEVGALLLCMDQYKGGVVVRAALQFSALTFCRPGEIRHAEWGEVDFEAREWRIPAEKMKMRKEHRVPLSRQAMLVLEDIRQFTGDGRYVFPGVSRSRPLSENGVTSALRRMGYSGDQMTAHGFRAMASTLLNELGFRGDVIEAQLAHTGGDKIRAIYNRAEYMKERRRLMQAWADYLDELRARAQSVSGVAERLA